MEAGLIIGNQIIIMFIILIIGAFCYLKGIITKDGTKQLSSFALNIINPVLIFMSYQSKYDKSLVHGLLWSFLLSAISYAVTILLTYVLIRKKTPDLAVERVSSIYSNCAFMCIPLISPSVIAVVVGLICYLTNVRLPKVPATALQYIADMNTPIAMVIAGATAAQTNVLKALQNRRIYYVSLCKLLILPVAGFFAMWILDPPPIVLMTVTIAAACPAATMCTMFAVNLDKDPKTASEIFTITTILSAVTLPLITIFADRLTYHI